MHILNVQRVRTTQRNPRLRSLQAEDDPLSKRANVMKRNSEIVAINSLCQRNIFLIMQRVTLIELVGKFHIQIHRILLPIKDKEAISVWWRIQQSFQDYQGHRSLELFVPTS